MLKILIEGNLDTLHSYSLVNRFQIIELAKNYKNKVKIYLKNISNKWKSHSQYINESQHIIKSLEIYNNNNKIDVIYRITYPINIISNNLNIPIFVFLTVESDFNKIKFKNNIKPTKKYLEKNNIHLITPSTWCFNILKQHNLDSSIIPHGIDTNIFYKIKKDKINLLKTKMNIMNKYIYLHIGACTDNKGIFFLLKAFSKLIIKKPNSILIIKGQDILYHSSILLNNIINKFPNSKLLRKYILIINKPLSFECINVLYNISDCYVSPYLAEGFNLPCLEAYSLGLDIICSNGGPTDDFIKTKYKIITTLQNNILQPDWNDLYKHMISVQNNNKNNNKNKFLTWKNIIDKLLQLINNKLNYLNKKKIYL